MIATIATRGHFTRRVECSGNTRDGYSIASTTSASDCVLATGGRDADTVHGVACPYMSLVDKKCEPAALLIAPDYFFWIYLSVNTVSWYPVNRVMCKYCPISINSAAPVTRYIPAETVVSALWRLARSALHHPKKFGRY